MKSCHPYSCAVHIILSSSWSSTVSQCVCLCVCISVGYSQCCYADWLEPRSDSSTVTPVLRHTGLDGSHKKRSLHRTRGKLLPCKVSLDPEGTTCAWTADVTQLCVLMWIIQDAAMQTEWSHRKSAGGVRVTHTAVQLLSVQLDSLCYTVGSWRFVRKVVLCVYYWTKLIKYVYIMNWELSHRLGPKVVSETQKSPLTFW